MEKLDYPQLVKELEKATSLECEYKSTNPRFIVHCNYHLCIWTTALEAINEFCRKYNFIYFVDFNINSIVISL